MKKAILMIALAVVFVTQAEAKGFKHKLSCAVKFGHHCHGKKH